MIIHKVLNKIIQQLNFLTKAPRLTEVLVKYDLKVCQQKLFQPQNLEVRIVSL